MIFTKDEEHNIFSPEIQSCFTLGSFGRFETDNACLFRVHGNERGESSFLNVTRSPYAVKCSMSRGFVRPCVPLFDHPFGSWERGFYCFHIKIFALYIYLPCIAF